MHRLTAIVLVLVSCLALAGTGGAEEPMPLMNLYQPKDTGWVTPVPQPVIPPPPEGKGLTDAEKLTPSEPLLFVGNEALAAEAAKPKGVVRGKGTEDDPYVIRDLVITGITKTHGIDIRNVTAPLIIENVRVTGTPIDERTPAEAQGILLCDGKNTIVRHCEVSKCAGIQGVAPVKTLFEDNLVFSCDTSIYTIRGSDCIARGNYVRDAQRYGIFLYHGPRHIIENNYVAWTQREGIGTNGDGQEAIYRNNVILHSGWTAINVEGTANDSLVENNLVVDTFYGIILEGSRTVCRKNKIYNSAQAGILFLGLGGQQDDVIEDNLIACSGSSGVEILGSVSKMRLTNNRIEQSQTGIRVAGRDHLVEGNDIFRFFNAVELSDNAENCRIINNKMYRGRNAVMIKNAKAPVIQKNTMSYLLIGVQAGASKGGTVEENTLVEAGVVFHLSGTEGWTFRKNILDRIPYAGFSMTNCQQCIVTENVMGSGPASAVTLQGGSANQITKNTITSIKGLWDSAALMISSSKDNQITGNTFERNAIAVSFKGADNTGNVLKENTYKENVKNITMQQGAKDVDTTNTLEQPAVQR